MENLEHTNWMGQKMSASNLADAVNAKSGPGQESKAPEINAGKKHWRSRRTSVEDASPNAWIYWSLSAGTLLVVFLGWFLATSLLSLSYLPSPISIVHAVIEMIHKGYGGVSIWTEIWVSVKRVLLGFFVGSAVGVVLGLWAGYQRAVHAVIAPILGFLRPIPPIAFIPLSVLVFGIGNTGKVVLVAYVAFNYVLVNAIAGAAGIPNVYLRAGSSLGLKPRQIFVHIIVPNALPQIFTGLKIALALSWAVLVAAELIGAQTGLGYLIGNASLILNVPDEYVGIILIGVIGVAMNLVLSVMEGRIVHWQGK